MNNICTAGQTPNASVTKLLKRIMLPLPQKLSDQWKESGEGWGVHKDSRSRLRGDSFRRTENSLTT